MRTTITLDEDVAKKLKDEMRRSGRGLKDTINTALRVGLTPPKKERDRRRFEIRARALGIRAGLDYDRIAELVEHIEGPLGR